MCFKKSLEKKFWGKRNRTSHRVKVKFRLKRVKVEEDKLVASTNFEIIRDSLVV